MQVIKVLEKSFRQMVKLSNGYFLQFKKSKKRTYFHTETYNIGCSTYLLN